MIQFNEGVQSFVFGDKWIVLKLDESNAYRTGIEKRIQGTKAVDFVGVFNAQELYLIEVKDFRGHHIENRERLLKGELPVEVAQKVRDSLACIVGAFHNSSDLEEWKPYMQKLCNPNSEIKVVVWLEEDLPPSHPSLRRKSMDSTRASVFKQKLAWLTKRVLVCSSREQGLPELTVTNLSHT